MSASRHLARTSVAFALATLVTACGIAGNGVPASEVRPVEGFNALKLDGPFTAEVTVDAAQGVPRLEVGGDANLVPLIRTEVRNGTLDIGMHDAVRPELPLKISIHLSDLATLTANGASKIDLKGLANSAFAVKLNGAADLVGTGHTGALTVDLSGAGHLDLKGLSADAVTAHVSGAGSVEVAPVKTLDVHISGAASLRYSGAPAVTQDISGVGSVKPL